MRAKFYLLGALILLIATSSLGWPTVASASTVYELNLGTLLNGSTPAGPAPWLTADFEDVGSNKVKLTLTSHLTSPNDVKGASNASGTQGWVFNFGGDFTGFKIANDTTNHGYFASLINISKDGLKVPSSKEFDIGFNWSSTNRFVTGAVETYIITSNGIKAFDFMQKNADGYYSAAHVQDIVTSSGTSGTIVTNTFNTVPIPGAVWLLGSGLLGLMGLKRKILG